MEFWEPHRVAYPGMSRNGRDRIETHTKSLKTLLAKDGVIYKVRPWQLLLRM